jgi:cbb3-type cytochrome oxidase subunit 3
MKALAIFIMALVLAMPFIAGVDDEEITVFNLELDKILSLGSSLLAIVLAGFTYIAYRRSRKARLLYVSAAFLLFSLKTFLIGAEVLFGEWPWVDPVSSFMDFAILLVFFAGVIRK